MGLRSFEHLLIRIIQMEISKCTPKRLCKHLPLLQLQKSAKFRCDIFCEKKSTGRHHFCAISPSLGAFNFFISEVRLNEIGFDQLKFQSEKLQQVQIFCFSIFQKFLVLKNSRENKIFVDNSIIKTFHGEIVFIIIIDIIILSPFFDDRSTDSNIDVDIYCRHRLLDFGNKN